MTLIVIFYFFPLTKAEKFAKITKQWGGENSPKMLHTKYICAIESLKILTLFEKGLKMKKPTFAVRHILNGTTTVGTFGTYGYGMCDMAGNVWEWMGDTGIYWGMAKGGSWGTTFNYCLVWNSAGAEPDSTNFHAGFRVATPEPTTLLLLGLGAVIVMKRNT